MHQQQQRRRRDPALSIEDFGSLVQSAFDSQTIRLGYSLPPSPVASTTPSALAVQSVSKWRPRSHSRTPTPTPTPTPTSTTNPHSFLPSISPPPSNSPSLTRPLRPSKSMFGTLRTKLSLERLPRRDRERVKDRAGLPATPGPASPLAHSFTPQQEETRPPTRPAPFFYSRSRAAKYSSSPDESDRPKKISSGPSEAGAVSVTSEEIKSWKKSKPKKKSARSLRDLFKVPSQSPFSLPYPLPGSGNSSSRDTSNPQLPLTYLRLGSNGGRSASSSRADLPIQAPPADPHRDTNPPDTYSFLNLDLGMDEDPFARPVHVGSTPSQTPATTPSPTTLDFPGIHRNGSEGDGNTPDSSFVKTPSPMASSVAVHCKLIQKGKEKNILGYENPPLSPLLTPTQWKLSPSPTSLTPLTPPPHSLAAYSHSPVSPLGGKYFQLQLSKENGKETAPSPSPSPRRKPVPPMLGLGAGGGAQAEPGSGSPISFEKWQEHVRALRKGHDGEDKGSSFVVGDGVPTGTGDPQAGAGAETETEKKDSFTPSAAATSPSSGSETVPSLTKARSFSPSSEKEKEGSTQSHSDASRPPPPHPSTQAHPPHPSSTSASNSGSGSNCGSRDRESKDSKEGSLSGHSFHTAFSNSSHSHSRAGSHAGSYCPTSPGPTTTTTTTAHNNNAANTISNISPPAPGIPIIIKPAPGPPSAFRLSSPPKRRNPRVVSVSSGVDSEEGVVGVFGEGGRKDGGEKGNEKGDGKGEEKEKSGEKGGEKEKSGEKGGEKEKSGEKGGEKEKEKGSEKGGEKEKEKDKPRIRPSSKDVRIKVKASIPGMWTSGSITDCYMKGPAKLDRIILGPANGNAASTPTLKTPLRSSLERDRDRRSQDTEQERSSNEGSYETAYTRHHHHPLPLPLPVRKHGHGRKPSYSIDCGKPTVPIPKVPSPVNSSTSGQHSRCGGGGGGGSPITPGGTKVNSSGSTGSVVIPTHETILANLDSFVRAHTPIAWPLPPKLTVVIDPETGEKWSDVSPVAEFQDRGSPLLEPSSRHSIRYRAVSSTSSLPTTPIRCMLRGKNSASTKGSCSDKSGQCQWPGTPKSAPALRSSESMNSLESALSRSFFKPLPPRPAGGDAGKEKGKGKEKGGQSSSERECITAPASAVDSPSASAKGPRSSGTNSGEIVVPSKHSSTNCCSGTSAPSATQSISVSRRSSDPPVVCIYFGGEELDVNPEEPSEMPTIFILCPREEEELRFESRTWAGLSGFCERFTEVVVRADLAASSSRSCRSSSDPNARIVNTRGNNDNNNNATCSQELHVAVMEVKQRLVLSLSLYDTIMIARDIKPIMRSRLSLPTTLGQVMQICNQFPVGLYV